jgi:MFS family permease
MVGLLVTIYGVARLFTNLPTGLLADRIGRRPLMLAGPVFTGIGAIIAVFATDFWVLLAARFVQGVGSALFATAAMIVVGDISRPETRGKVMSFFQGSLLLGTSIGPTVGGISAALFGYRGVFVVYAVSCVGVWIWGYLRVKETRGLALADDAAAKHAGAPKGANALGLFANLSFLAVSAVSIAIFFTRTGARFTLIPLIGSEDLGLSALTIGNVLTIGSIANVLVLPFAGWSIDRLGRKRTIVPSTVISSLGILMFALAPNLITFVAASAVLGIGTGIAGPAPAAYVADLAHGRSFGATMGLFRTVSDVGFVAGPVLLGWIADQRGYAYALYVNAGLLFAAAVFFALFARETKVTPEVVVAGRARTSQPTADD